MVGEIIIVHIKLIYSIARKSFFIPVITHLVFGKFTLHSVFSLLFYKKITYMLEKLSLV